LHGVENKLVILTPNDVNYIKDETTVYRYNFTSTISQGKIFITSTNDLYYTLPDGLNVKYNVNADWSAYDTIYSISTTPSIGSNNINYIYCNAAAVEPETNAYAYGNTIVVATANGTFVINEKRGNGSDSVKSFGYTGKTFNILDSNDCILAWGDNVDNCTYGRIYIGDSIGNLYILNNIDNSILYKYSDTSGNYGDYLNSTVLSSFCFLP
jgi:hypothetical protein